MASQHANPTWSSASMITTQDVNMMNSVTGASLSMPNQHAGRQSVDSGANDATNDDLNADAEGVWSPDIEQSFQEALSIYPPCGRRKIILSDEGKMYGRNELIARYIKLRTGKSRSRKQVSSHIQVLARRKSKEIQSTLKDTVSKDNKIIQSIPLTRRTSPSIHNGYSASLYDNQDPSSRDKALQTMSTMSSAQIVSPIQGGGAGTKQPPQELLADEAITPDFWNASNQDIKPVYQTSQYPAQSAQSLPLSALSNLHPNHDQTNNNIISAGPAWKGRSIVGERLRLVEFLAFLETTNKITKNLDKHLFVYISSELTYDDPLLEAVDVVQIYDKFPEKQGGLKELYGSGPKENFYLVKFWANMNVNIPDEKLNAFYGVTSRYESNEKLTIECSTKVCSFGRQVVEKVETESGTLENGKYQYKLTRSAMCEYMINFIHKLKHLPEKYMMNSVLENFTILQVVTCRETKETLLCIGYVFEVSTSDARHHIYKLIHD